MVKEFAGCLYLRGPGSKKRRAEEWTDLEIPPEALKQAQIVGKPILISHEDSGPVKQVGKITDVWFDKYDGCHAKFAIDEPFFDTFIELCNKDQSTVGRGLSISHRKTSRGGMDTYDVSEVSVCHRNARYGSVINNTMTPDEYKVYTSSEEYTPSLTESLKDPLNRLHLQNSCETAIATMEPQGPHGNPHVITEQSGTTTAASLVAPGTSASAYAMSTSPAQQQTVGSTMATATGATATGTATTATAAAAAPAAPTNSAPLIPPSAEEIVKAVESSDVNKEIIYSALAASTEAVAAKDNAIATSQAEINELKRQLEFARQATVTVQARADNIRAERDTLSANLYNSVLETMKRYLAEFDEVSPDLAKTTHEQMSNVLKQNPMLTPYFDVVVRAARHTSKRRESEEPSPHAVKFLKRGLACARPEEQVRDVVVDASRTPATPQYITPNGKGRAREDTGSHIPAVFRNSDSFSKYLDAARSMADL